MRIGRNRYPQRILGICLMAIITIFIVSCEKNAFDFSRFNGADSPSEWGVPLADATYNIENIVSRLGNNSILTIGEDNVLNMVYNAEFDEIVKASSFLNFNNLHEEDDIVITPDFDDRHRDDDNITLSYTVPLDMSNPYVLLISGVMESGNLDLIITHGLEEGGTIVVNSPNIFMPDGTPFAYTVDLTQNENNIHLNLAGYIIRPHDNNVVDITADINIPMSGSLSEERVIHYNYTGSSLALREADLVQTSRIAVPYDKYMNVHIQNGSFGGDFIVYDPIIKVSVKNSFDKDGACHLTTANFSGADMPEVSLLPSPVDIQIPNSPAAFEVTEMSTIPSIHFYADYSTLHISGEVVVEPTTETIHIDRSSSISVRIATEIPLRIDLNDISFRDTIKMNAVELPSADRISDLTLQILFENDLPIDVVTQIYFCDDNYEIIDSAFVNPHILQGAYANDPIFCEPIYIHKTEFNEIRRLLNCDYLLLSAKLNTHGKVDVDVRRYLRTKVSAKWNVYL